MARYSGNSYAEMKQKEPILYEHCGGCSIVGYMNTYPDAAVPGRTFEPPPFTGLEKENEYAPGRFDNVGTACEYHFPSVVETRSLQSCSGLHFQHVAARTYPDARCRLQ